MSLKLDGVRSFLVCYKKNVYAISTSGEETIIKSGVCDYDTITLFDTEVVNNVYHVFGIVIQCGVVVVDQPLTKRIRMIP